MNRVEIAKSRIIDYLEYAPEQVDALKLAYFLEGHADNSFYIIPGKRPIMSLMKQLKNRRS